MDGISSHFPANNALDSRILHIQFKSFPRVIYPETRSASDAWDPDADFRLARERFHSSCFTNRPLILAFCGFQTVIGKRWPRKACKGVHGTSCRPMCQWHRAAPRLEINLGKMSHLEMFESTLWAYVAIKPMSLRFGQGKDTCRRYNNFCKQIHNSKCLAHLLSATQKRHLHIEPFTVPFYV